jgi:hypothetical protein
MAPPAVKLATSNFFAPLRTAHMDTDAPVAEPSAEVPRKSAQPPPIVLTSAINLIQMQKQLKGVAPQSFKFCNTRNWTRVVTKDMVDYQAVKAHFDNNSLALRSSPNPRNP